MFRTGLFRYDRNVKSVYNIQNRNFFKRKKTCDKIGPPDPISNLHPVKYAVQENETPLEIKLRKHREELQNWNEIFWTSHNKSFIQKKRDFEKKENEKKGCENELLSADEISIFYKKFLDDNWGTYVKYLSQWYKKNTHLVIMSANLWSVSIKKLDMMSVVKSH